MTEPAKRDDVVMTLAAWQDELAADMERARGMLARCHYRRDEDGDAPVEVAHRWLTRIVEDRARWDLAAEQLYASHALDVRQRAVKEDLFGLLGLRSEVREIIASRRARGVTR